jgi:enterochelin esterase-like enzyme
LTITNSPDSPPPPRRGGRRRAGRLAILAGAALSAVALGVSAAPAVAHAQDRQAPAPTQLGPLVKHTGSGPTGYTVTFRYYDPTATSVQIKGEWYFSSPSETTTSTSQGLLPSQWQPGDFPMPDPNQPAANWPVIAMTEDAATGVWSYTTPLPSGTFSYGFFVNCASATQTGCTEVSDPANPPWNDVNGVSTGSVEPLSQVYVPSDPRFGTTDFSWQAPSLLKGHMADVSYPDPDSTSPVGSHPLAVYTPPGYNPNRKVAYPTLYLSHGAGGNEVDWSTQGDAVNILDNMILAGRIQPMVVVMTDFNGLSGGVAGYSSDVINNVIPYVEAHYNVSTNADDRAFAGLSAGGQRANDLLFNHTSEFGYYSVMSNAGGTPATISTTQATAIQSLLGLQLGVGNFDPLLPNTQNEEAKLTAAGDSYTNDMLNGGHEWYVWRVLLHDFLSGIVFKATNTSVTVSHGVAVATVHAGTTEPIGPLGTVQFYVNGAKAGFPAIAFGGKALAILPGLKAGQTVTAVYSGDNYYNSSTSSAVTAG